MKRRDLLKTAGAAMAASFLPSKLAWAQSHPGCSVVPAALAVGEKWGIDGQRYLRAVALGYDIGPRFTATLGKLQYMADTHRSTHALAGTFGSAAAAACAAGLNAQQM